MTDPAYQRDTRFAAHVLRPARIIRSVCQMLLGAGLAIALIVKVYMLVLTDYQCNAELVSLGNSIRCVGTLEMMSYALMLAAGFELAYLLFEDTLERAVRPLLLGLSAVFLMLISELDGTTQGWEMALTIVALSLALFGGLAFRVWMASHDGQDKALRETTARSDSQPNG